MNLKMRIVRTAALFCLCLLPKMSYGSACTTQTLATLLGTTCSIGDVNYAFIASSFSNPGSIVLTPNDLTLTPDGSNPLNPLFSLTPSSGGPFSASAFGVENSSSIGILFNFHATILTTGLQFGSETSTLVNPVVPSAPSLGPIVGGGMALSIFNFVGPNVNPATATIDRSGPIVDGASLDLSAIDLTGSGATTSVDALELQYHLTPASTPEPSSLLLFGAGLLGLAMALKKLA